LRPIGKAEEGSSAPRYRNPPIVEAAISIEFQALADDILPSLRAFCATLKTAYPEQSARFQQEARLQFGKTVAYESQPHEDGTVCISSDRKRFAQISLSGLAFSRLAPYGSWADFESQVRPLWESFANTFAVQPSIVSLRYINKIDIPLDMKMEAFLRTYPEISHDLPQLIGPYFMRVQVPMVNRVGEPMLIMQQGFVQPTSANHYGILLDNELRYEVQSAADVWPKALLGRKEKNLVFEACITDELRERLS